MYIGLILKNGVFVSWHDGSPFGGGVYSNWKPENPCAALISDDGKWGDIPCSLGREAMCEKPQDKGWCASGWSPFGQCCYRMLTALQPVDVHRSDCQNRGGQLVSISSAAENSFVNQLQQAGCSSSPPCEAYIGLRRNSAGQFTSWLDGTSFGASYSNWQSGERNNAANIESCVAMTYATAKWIDIRCDEPHMAVCETCQPPASTSTTTTTITTTTPTTTTASTTTSTPTTTESTITPTTTVAEIIPTTSTSITDRALDCCTIRTNVNCSTANGHDACDAQCRLFKYGQGICMNFGQTSCPGYPLGSKGCLCNDALDCRTLRTQVNCATANAATSCTNWCKLFMWTQGACTTFQSSWTCPGYVAGQAACLCQ